LIVFNANIWAQLRQAPVVKRLLASIHDVSPKFEGQVDALRDRLMPHVRNRLAMLVVPDHWGDAPIRPGSPFARRLRRWSEEGIDMFVHGWFHRDQARHNGFDAWRAKRMTAGEGEFLGLSKDEALARMRRGKALVEDVIGREPAGFIAPAWLYSPGAREALAEAGFHLAESHGRVWAPRQGSRTVARGPVITWASRTRARQRSSLLAAAVLRHALRPAETVRVAVHPGDTAVPSLLRSIDRCLNVLTREHRPASYADLLT
jgi:predicted deacetylase